MLARTVALVSMGTFCLRQYRVLRTAAICDHRLVFTYPGGMSLLQGYGLPWLGPDGWLWLGLALIVRGLLWQVPSISKASSARCVESLVDLQFVPLAQ